MKRLNALVIHFANDDLRDKLRVILEDKEYALCEFLKLDGQANPAKQVLPDPSDYRFTLP